MIVRENGVYRISGQFDIHLMLEAIDAELEIHRQVSGGRYFTK